MILPDDRPAGAEEALLEFLDLERHGKEPDFAAFVARRPEIADELTSLHEAWQQVSGLLASKKGGFSLAKGAQKGLSLEASDAQEVAPGSDSSGGDRLPEAGWE